MDGKPPSKTHLDIILFYFYVRSKIFSLLAVVLSIPPLTVNMVRAPIIMEALFNSFVFSLI